MTWDDVVYVVFVALVAAVLLAGMTGCTKPRNTEWERNTEFLKGVL